MEDLKYIKSAQLTQEYLKTQDNGSGYGSGYGYGHGSDDGYGNSDGSGE